MPTVYERVQEHLKSSPGMQVSNSKMSRISNVLKYLYDRNKNKQPMFWVDSVEPTGTFHVRHYPPCFIRTMDRVISTILKTKPTTTQTQSVPKAVPKERKRVPVSRLKPVYSTRNVK